MAESEELKSLLMNMKEESEKPGLKFNIQKTKIIGSGPITSWKIDGETVETVADWTELIHTSCPVLSPAVLDDEVVSRLILNLPNYRPGAFAMFSVWVCFQICGSSWKKGVAVQDKFELSMIKIPSNQSILKEINLEYS